MNDDISQQPTVKLNDETMASALTESVSTEGWPIGALVDDRYRVLEVHGGPGVSGMGIVYVLESEGRRFAAKTFQHQFSKDLPLIQRFLLEARTWLLLGFHPNIVSAFSVDIIEATPYIVMEYVQPDDTGALSLADHMKHGPLDLVRGIDLALQCCDGMAHAFASVPGLVHRDLKPENLLVARDDSLKIADFGLVRSYIRESFQPRDSHERDTANQVTQLGAAMGTPAYMAPEQFVEADNVTQQTDLYAFGCCFYEAFSGRRMFEFCPATPIARAVHAHLNESPVPLLEYAPHCPRELNDIIMRCLEKDPKARFSGFDEVNDRLRFVLKNEFGGEYRPRSMPDPSPHDVAEQMRALTLIDGYGRAVRMRHLRNNHDTRPYAFHLALASYFRCHAEANEERRQLEKALRARGSGRARGPERARDNTRGDEAVRRLAERLVADGELEEARSLLGTFLHAFPNDLHLVQEPYVKLLVALGEIDQAAAILAGSEQNLHTDLLWGLVFQASHRFADWAALLRRRIDSLLNTVCRTIETVQAGDRAGWDNASDPAVLKRLLALAAPGFDAGVLDTLENATWPDITAYPDFADEMAWLSQAYGELAQLPAAVSDEERAQFMACANLLGFPKRLQRFLERDEAWLWHNGS